ncbi:MAG: ligase-associated DNA damage response endonuclease PdeM [Pseudomonadota bacterium]
MNMLRFSFAGLDLYALPSGGLWWPEEKRLLVADLHLGKAERIARRGGQLLPPYEVAETLERLARDIDATGAYEVLCLGDSFDDTACAAQLHVSDQKRLTELKSRTHWRWIAGNHDPQSMAGDHTEALRLEPLLLRHIAKPGPLPDRISGEITGHFHPKHHLVTRGGRVARRCFLVTETRVILPAYGAYTGGLALSDPAFGPFLTPGSRAILLGRPPVLVPLSVSEAAE